MRGLSLKGTLDKITEVCYSTCISLILIASIDLTCKSLWIKESAKASAK